jgi:predicted membrane metal-binding protein
MLGALCGVFILYLAYLGHRNSALESELSANRLQCSQQLSRLESKYRTEIDDLQQYLKDRYNYMPAQQQASADPTQHKPQSPMRPNAARTTELAPTVEHKYRYIYPDLDDPQEPVKEMLRQLLTEWEQLAAIEPRNAEQLAGIEAQIGELLGADGYQKFQLLKDSDPEQHHLREYGKSVEEYAPLTPQQDQAILLAKLKHKQTYKMALVEAGFYQTTWTAEERARAETLSRQALDRYKNSYLSEVRQFLSARQFTLLSSYETTEFNWELQRLQQQMDAKMINS